MKILHVIPYFYPAWRFGGSVRVAYDVSRKLVEYGHSVDVYTSDIENDAENTRVKYAFRRVSGVNVFYFRNLSTFAARRKLFFTPSLISAVRDNVKSFDVVHVHGNRTTQSPVLHHFLKKYSVPYVVQAHGGLPSVLGRRTKWLYDLLFGRRLLEDASKVIALTRTEAEQYRSAGISEEKIAIIPNGIDLSEYTNLPSKGYFKKFGIDEDKKVILYLGRIHELKGIDFLARAFSSLVKSPNCQNAVLVIAGPDDGYLSEMRQLVSSLGIANKVIFAGMLLESERIKAYVDSCVVVNVEPRNVFGLVPLEAVACQTPVIVSKGNAISETVSRGNFGFSVEYDDVNELARIMKEMLGDEVLLREMGQRGRRFVFENYNWANIVARLENVYKAMNV